MAQYVDKAIAAIEEADEKIRALIGEAVGKRSYNQLRELACLAEQISEVLDNLDGTAGADSDQLRKQGRDARRADAGEPKMSRQKPDTAATTQSARPKKVGLLNVSAFPLFVREGDALVKIGRSNAGSPTYEHRISRQAVDTVARRALSLCSTNDGRFTAEGISDVRTHEDSKKVPGYQLYLCLGWLKREGLIKQRGRKGYSLVDPDSFMREVERAWSELDRANRPGGDGLVEFRSLDDV